MPSLVIYLFEASKNKVAEINTLKNKYPDKNILLLANKVDTVEENRIVALQNTFSDLVLLSAKNGNDIEKLKDKLLSLSNMGSLGKNETIVTNNRHYDALLKALEAIQKVKEGMDMELSSDLMAIDIREALFHLGEITGSVSTDDLLGNIFSNFCIGK